MGEVGRHLKIIRQSWRATLIQAMEYRTSFLLGLAANGIDFTFGLIQYALFFTVAEKIAGWEMNQMLAFYAVFMTVFSLHFIFLYPNLESIDQLVNSGQLDLVLCKPVSAQFILSFRRLSFDELGSFLAAQVLLWGLVLSGGLSLNPLRVAGFGVAILCSFVIIYSVFLLFMALTVWFEKMENLSDLLWSLFGLCRYPVDIYPRPLRGLFYAIVPVGFVVTVPARTLVMGEEPWVLALGLLISVAGLFLSRVFWKLAISGYRSAGG